MATLHAFPTMKVTDLNDSWELSSEGSIEYDYDNSDAFTLNSYEEDETWTRDMQWPNRGRFNNLPALSALIQHHCPPPLTKPSPLTPEYRDLWDKHCADVDVLEQERLKLADKMNAIEKELAKAEQAPQNYSAARWGATSTRDALVKRLTNDVKQAYEKVVAKGKEIDALKASRKGLGEYVATTNSMMDFYEKTMKEKHESLKQMYGELQPIKEHQYIPLFVEGAKAVRIGEDLASYTFLTAHSTEMTMRQLELGGNHHLRRDGLNGLTVFDRV